MVSSLAFLFKLNKPCRLPDSGLPAIQCGSGVLDFAMDPFNRQQLAAGEYRSEDLEHFGCLLFTCMGKPVASGFGQMVRKIQDW